MACQRPDARLILFLDANLIEGLDALWERDEIAAAEPMRRAIAAALAEWAVALPAAPTMLHHPSRSLHAQPPRLPLVRAGGTNHAPMIPPTVAHHQPFSPESFISKRQRTPQG